MNDIAPQAPLLTAEEEARWRAYAYEMRAQPEGEKMLRLFAILDAVRRDRNAWRAQSDRQVADIAALISQLDAARAETEAVRALAAELVEDYAIAARIVERAQHIQAPEDAEVEALCKRFGYGAVMDAASRLWVGLDPIGAIVPGACLGIVQRALARARALGIGGEREKNDG